MEGGIIAMEINGLLKQIKTVVAFSWSVARNEVCCFIYVVNYFVEIHQKCAHVLDDLFKIYIHFVKFEYLFAYRWMSVYNAFSWLTAFCKYVLKYWEMRNLVDWTPSQLYRVLDVCHSSPYHTLNKFTDPGQLW